MQYHNPISVYFELFCAVSALREIESVVIDSSFFVKVRTDVYRVHLTLKNTAIYAVATPALELTLTNVRSSRAVISRGSRRNWPD